MPQSDFRFNFGPPDWERYGATAGVLGLGPRDEDEPKKKDLADKIIGIESRGDADAKNPRSSATGAGQFIDSTWLDLMERHHPDLVRGRSKQELLELRKNKPLSKEMVNTYAEENNSQLRQQGIPVLPETTYLAHFLGPSGASRVLKSRPGTRVDEILPSNVIDANPFLKDKSNTDVLAWARRKMNGGPEEEAPDPAETQFAQLETKEPGRYKVINADELPGWQKQWQTENPEPDFWDRVGTVASNAASVANEWLTERTEAERQRVAQGWKPAEDVKELFAEPYGISEQEIAKLRESGILPKEQDLSHFSRERLLRAGGATADIAWRATMAPFIFGISAFVDFLQQHGLDDTSAGQIERDLHGILQNELGRAGEHPGQRGHFQTGEKIAGDAAAAESLNRAHTILGVGPDATTADIKAAYRTKAKEVHPDVGGTPEAFADLSWAYQQALKTAKPGPATVRTAEQAPDVIYESAPGAISGPARPAQAPGETPVAPAAGTTPPPPPPPGAAPAAGAVPPTPPPPPGPLARAVAKAPQGLPVRPGEEAAVTLDDGTALPVTVQAVGDGWATVQDANGESYQVPLEIVVPSGKAKAQEAAPLPRPSQALPVGQAPSARLAAPEPSPAIPLGDQTSGPTIALPDEMAGTRAAPVKVEAPADLEVAEAKVAPEPTDGQKEAGNYQKGHLKVHGLNVTLENAKGSIRSGKGPDGKPWQVTMPAAYGYVKGTKGKDGDQVDVYVGDEPASDRVFVIDQTDAETGKFDEHKVVLGVGSPEEALALHSRAFSDGRGPDRQGAITEMPVEAFKEWLSKGKRTKPVGTIPEKRSAAAEIPPAPTPDDLEIPAFLRRTPQEGGTKPTETAAAPEAAPEPAPLKTVEQEIEEIRPKFDAYIKDKGNLRRVRFALNVPQGVADRLMEEAAKDGRLIHTRAGFRHKPEGYDERVARLKASAEARRTTQAESKPRPVPAMAKEPVQQDMLGGPEVKGSDIAIREEASARIQELRNEGIEDAEILEDARDDAEFTEPGNHLEAKQKRLAEAIVAELERQPARVPMKKGEKPAKADNADNADNAKSELSATPQITLARALVERLKSGKAITAKMLQDDGATAYGGTMASGKFTRKDAYDALELAVNMRIREDVDMWATGFPGWEAPQQKIAKLLERLPTQTVRSEEQQLFQQFSTPPTYAHAAGWVANVRPGDVLMEPSAGTGSLLAPVMGEAGVKVIANELAPARAALLRELVGDKGRVFTENAEQIDNILPADVKPTLVVMNPPFSQTAGRMGDKKDINVGATHVEQALARLEPGGRLVAIVGRGMTMGAPSFRQWWKKIGGQYAVRANIGVEGSVYAKYGTTFGTRLLVIDKVPPDGVAPTLETAQTVDDLMRVLEPIRDARPAAERQPAQPSRVAVAQGSEGASRPARAPRPDTGTVGTGKRSKGGLAGAGETDTRAATRPAGGVEAGKRDELAVPKPGRGRPTGAGGQPARGAENGEQPAASGGRGAEHDLADAAKPKPGAPDRVELEHVKPGSQVATAALTDSLYEPYQPQKVSVKGAKPHPGPLVQSAAMASVEPPTPTYRPSLPANVVKDGLLSIAQLESVIYAGQAHEQMLPAAEDETPRRKGFFIGDGTGVGKGREIGGIILDNFGQGRTKAVWVSEREKLLADAKRDWKGLGQDEKQIFNVGKVKTGETVPAKQGIGFITYDTLKGGMSDQAVLARGGFVRRQRVTLNGQPGMVQAVIKGKRGAPTEYKVKLDAGGESIATESDLTAEGGTQATLKSRLDQIVEWVGEDFDGVIAFDEAHNMGNAISVDGDRGKQDAAKKALAGLELQKRLPNARVVYVSATGATEVSNLAYADRLGLWGRGTPFASRNDFIAQVESGGIAAMELVARDMKQLGLYTARNLSFDDGTPQGRVEYDRREHTLDAPQREIYDTLAEAWQTVLHNINDALELTGGDGNRNAKSAAYSAFWGGHQRFFNQIITSMQMPSVIRAVEEDLAAGRQAVLQLTNTNEASQERAVAKARSAEELEDLDITPRDQIIQLVEHSFPTQQYEEFEDEDGNVRSRPVLDSEGKPVENKRAVALREALIERLASVRVPQGPLEMVLDHFGIDTVAEVTGRKRRFVMKPDKTGNMKRTEDSRPGSSNQAETDAFQAGKKKVLVFSEAGGTGASYHADNASASRGARRSHHLVQAGWRADKAVQGFGRTHRTNQESAPIFTLWSTDLKGQKRFISSIARRLGQLGALTKGQRQAGDQGLFSARDNLEGREAVDALKQFFVDLYRGNIDGITIDDFEEQTGLQLRKRDKEGAALGLKEELPPITQFLNRLLSLKFDLQNQVFDAFSERLDNVVAMREAAGDLDAGLETIRANKIEQVSEQTVHTMESSGAETKYVRLKLSNRFRPTPFEKVAGKEGLLKWLKSPKGKVYAAMNVPAKTDTSTGHLIDQYKLVGPVAAPRFIDRSKVDFGKEWEDLLAPDAETLWQTETDAAPEFVSSDMHLITGVVLPVWDRLKGSTRVVRVQTDDGERLIGRVVPSGKIAATLQALGADAGAAKVDTADLYPALMAGSRAKLANGWVLKRSLVANEHRIELVGPSSYAEGQEVKADGVFTERISYQVRYFVPAEPEDAQNVLGALTKHRPVVEMGEGNASAGEAEEAFGERPAFRASGFEGKIGDFVDLGEFKRAGSEPLARQAQDYVAAKGRETGNEYLLAIDADGSVIAHGHGGPSGIVPPDDLNAAMQDSARSIIVHHNHPRDTGLSRNDIKALSGLGLRAVWAEGHAGINSRASLTPAMRSKLAPLGVVTSRKKMESLVNATFGSVYDLLAKAVAEGRATVEEWDRAMDHLANHVLDEAGIIDYQANADLTGLIDRLGLREALDKVISEASRSAFDHAPKPRIHRPATALRHPGDVGAVFGDPQDLSVQHARAERGNQADRVPDRKDEGPPDGFQERQEGVAPDAATRREAQRESALKRARDAIFGRSKADEPEFSAKDGTLVAGNARIDPLSKELLKGNVLGLFEAATDRLRRSKHPILVDLAGRVDRYYDQREARVGWVNGRIRPVLKELGINVVSRGKTIREVTRPFEEYWRHHDNGREVNAEAALKGAPEGVRKLVAAVKRLYSEMGDANQAIGVKVFDARLGGWRPIGKVQEGKFWPRMLRPEVQRVLQNPNNDRGLWRDLVDALIDEGHIESRAEAERYIRNYFTDEVKNDYFAGIEKARARPLPEIFYDYSWDAFQRYAWKWAARTSQIEQFGQVTGRNSKEAFGRAIEATLDRSTQSYLSTLSDLVYERRPTDAYTSLLTHLNMLATGLQLGNPGTATVNLIGGTTLNAQMFGARRTAQAYVSLVKDWSKVQAAGVQYGILGKDVLNILRDAERSPGEYFEVQGRTAEALAAFARITMTWGGYRGTENIVRATAMSAGWLQLQDALHAWNKNPGSATSVKYRDFMQRNSVDAGKLLAENGHGQETARYLRLMVNLAQGSYRADMVPLYVDTPMGRFLFKYQKFGTQVSRLFWQNFLQPFVKAVEHGTAAQRAETFGRLLRYFAYAFVGGSAMLAVRQALFNYNDPGADWADIVKAFEDKDLARAWALILDRAFYSSMAGSAAGFFGNYIQFGLDYLDQMRVKNPLDPAGLASIDAATELLRRAFEQGRLTGRDLDQIAEQTLSLYRGYKRIGLTGLHMAGSEWHEVRLLEAQRDVNYIRKATREYAEQSGIEQKRTISGRIGKTPMSPVNQQIWEALILGDVETARAIVRATLEGKDADERRKTKASMQASARSRQPILIAGGGSDAERAKFLRWARSNLAKSNFQRVQELHRRYHRAGERAGLMKAGDE